MNASKLYASTTILYQEKIYKAKDHDIRLEDSITTSNKRADIMISHKSTHHIGLTPSGKSCQLRNARKY